MLVRRQISEVFEAFINPDIATEFWFSYFSWDLFLNPVRREVL